VSTISNGDCWNMNYLTLNKIKNKLPLSVLRKIYFAFVYPHILYGIEIYANTDSIYLKKLKTPNKKLLHNKPLKIYITISTL